MTIMRLDQQSCLIIYILALVWMGLFKLLNPTKDDNYEFRSAVLSYYIYIGIDMDGVI